MSGPDALRIVVVFPRLLGTYGDAGNATVLARRAQSFGLAAEIVTVEVGEPVPTSGDIYLLGGGEDANQLAAGRGIEADGGLVTAIDAGAVVLAVCAGFQLLGEPGLGILDVSTQPMAARAVGNVRARVCDLDPPLADPVLIGFENHRGGTVLGPNARPLSRVEAGTGNDVGAGHDGVVSGRIYATYLHGPVLAINPSLADHLLGLVAGALPERPPGSDAAVDRMRAERLAVIARERA